MRSRPAVLLALAAVCLSTGVLWGAPARADDGAAVLAQTGDPTGEEEEAEGQEGQGEEGEGAGDPEAETGAGGESEGAGSTETGPPWTYQMARLSLGILVLLALGIGLFYYRLVAKRQRGAV